MIRVPVLQQAKWYSSVPTLWICEWRFSYCPQIQCQWSWNQKFTESKSESASACNPAWNKETSWTQPGQKEVGYLFKEIRQFVSDAWKDTVAPEPLTLALLIQDIRPVEPVAGPSNDQVDFLSFYILYHHI